MDGNRDQPMLAGSAIYALRQGADHIEKWLLKNNLKAGEVAVELQHVMNVIENFLEENSLADCCSIGSGCEECAPTFRILYNRAMLRLVK